MADKIQIKGGTGKVPVLSDREFGFDKDGKALYIGTMSGNIKLCDSELENRIKAYIDEQASEINARLVVLENKSEQEGNE